MTAWQFVSSEVRIAQICLKEPAKANTAIKTIIVAVFFIGIPPTVAALSSYLSFLSIERNCCFLCDNGHIGPMIFCRSNGLFYDCNMYLFERYIVNRGRKFGDKGAFQ
jgi:hypothetical protein